MKMGKLRITLIPRSECETVTGKELEKCSVVVMIHVVIWKIFLFTNSVQNSVVLGRRF